MNQDGIYDVLCMHYTCHQRYRKHIEKAIRALLLADHVSHSVVKSLLVHYSRLQLDADACVNSLAEIISDIREPISISQSDVTGDERRHRDLKVNFCVCIPGFIDKSAMHADFSFSQGPYLTACVCMCSLV